MRLRLLSYGLSIVPESAQDLLYIRSLGIEKPGDTITLRLITVCLDETHSWIHAADIDQADNVELTTEGVVQDLKDHPEAEGLPEETE